MKKFFLVVLCGLLIFSFTSCVGKFKYTDYSFDSFDTVTTIMGYGKTKDEFDAVAKETKNMLSHYHKLFDIYNEYEGINNLCTINKKGGELTVDREIIDLLLFAKEMYNLSDKNVNVAMGSVLSIWHDYRTKGSESPKDASLPPMELLKEASNHTNIEHVIINEEKSTVFLADRKLKLDVGALAKGYALEKCAKHLEEKGVSGYLINLGGNVRAIGPQPGGKDWSVAIENPSDENTSPYIDNVPISHEGVATSGNYQRFYTVGDKNYHHIIDGKTLMPKDLFASVSVITHDAGLSDALSTTLFLMPIDKGKELLKKIPDAKAIWVLPDGEIVKN